MSYDIPPLKDKSLYRSQAFVNGQWIDAKSGKTFDITDPSTGKAIGSMPDMDAHDTEAAIAAAHAALPSFGKITGRERGRMLRKWYDLMIENAGDLARLITWENGKPLAEAMGEVIYAANYFEWFSEEAPRINGETIPSSFADRKIFTIKQPIGVCGLVTPWNWPAGMITRKIGPALAAGCTLVLKSPGETPLTAGALGVLAERAGIPPGVINIITALQNTIKVGEVLTTSPVVKKVSFTGSTRVGKILMKQSSSTLKKLSFELGGNAPFIVFNDADLDSAVEGAISCKFRSSGQTCVCANRIYVQRGIYDTFTSAFTAQVQQFKVGSGKQPGITHGPLIHSAALEKTEQHITDAINKGGRVIAGGHRIPELGANYFQPTVIRDMKNNMLLAHDETFGPVAGIFPFDTEAEIVQLANDTEVGLAGFLYTKDLARAYRVAEAVEVGMMGVNTGLVSDVAMPFGGVKESGFGREGSGHGVDEYLTVKAVTLGGMGRPLETA